VAIGLMYAFNESAKAAEELSKEINDINEGLADTIQRTEALRDTTGDRVAAGVEIILGVDVPTAEEMAKDALEGGRLIEQSWDDFMVARAASYENLTESDQQFIDNAMKDLEIYYEHWKALQAKAENDVSFSTIEKSLKDAIKKQDKWGPESLVANIHYAWTDPDEAGMSEYKEALNEIGDDVKFWGHDPLKLMEKIIHHIREGGEISNKALETFGQHWGDNVESLLRDLLETAVVTEESATALFTMATESDTATGAIEALADGFGNATEEMTGFANAREELFFGGTYGNVTGSLYRQVVQQGVGTLYNKQEVIMSNNFHGFFNEQEAAERIITVLDDYFKGKI